MTSLIRQTQRSLFQQVSKYRPTYNDIDFPNCVLNFLLKLCNTLRSIFIDNILAITLQKKVKSVQIWATWQPLANSIHKKLGLKGHHIFRCVWHIILLKNCILLILKPATDDLRDNCKHVSWLSREKKVRYTRITDTCFAVRTVFLLNIFSLENPFYFVILWLPVRNGSKH